MKYYKSIANEVYAYEADGSQDAFIKPDLIPITEQEADALRFVPASTVPASVTMRQARIALYQAGLLQTVNNAIANMPGAQGDAARIEWEFSNDVLRTQPLVLAMKPILELTDDQLDQLFLTASQL